MDLAGEHKFFFILDFSVLDHVDGDVVVDHGKDIQIQGVDIALHFQDVLFSHLIAAGVLDDRYCAVQLVQFQVMIDFKALACLDMVEHETFFNFSNI